MTQLGLPAYDPATDEGKVLTIVGGRPGWVPIASGGGGGGFVSPFIGGGWDPAAACGGGRGQVVAFAADGSYVNSGGDQGGSNHCADYTGYFKWYCTNAHATDQNNHRTINAIFQHRTVPSTWYKLTEAGFWISTDGGVNWSLDATAGAPQRTQLQPGLTATDDPRAVDCGGWTDGAGNIICPTETGVARKLASTGVWDTANFPRADGKCLQVTGNPLSVNEVWAVVATNVAGTYNSYLYRCTNINAASPTWVGPFTGGSTFTGSGYTFYPQHVRFSGNGILVTCVNPAAVGANDAHETGLFVLDARTSTLTALFHTVTTLTVPARTTTNSRCISNLDVVKYGDGTTGVLVCWTNTTSASAVSYTEVTGDFSSTNLGAGFVDASATQTNLINGVSSTPWALKPTGSSANFFAAVGFPSGRLNPVTKGHAIFGGFQGFYRSTNINNATPVIYPIPFGAGGVVAYPGAAFDSNGSGYIGMSDICMVPTWPLTGGAINPAHAFFANRPTTTTNQTHGSLIAVDSGDVVVMATRDYAIAANYGVYIHDPIDNAVPAAPTWPGVQSTSGGTSGQNDGWVSQGFPTGDTSHAYLGLAVVKNGSAQRVIVAAQGTDGWWRKVAGGAVAHPTTPPPTAGTYADTAVYGDGDGRMAAYADTGGLYISTDYGDHWSQILSGTFGVIPAIIRNFCGFVEFQPGDHDTLYVTNDQHIYVVQNAFTAPVAYDISAGVITSAGAVCCTTDEVLVVQRGTSATPTQVYHAEFPTGSPPATAWTAIPDPDGRLAGQGAFACKIAVSTFNDVVVSSLGGGAVLYQADRG